MDIEHWFLKILVFKSSTLISRCCKTRWLEFWGIRGAYLDHWVKNIEGEIRDRILLEVPMVDHPACCKYWNTQLIYIKITYVTQISLLQETLHDGFNIYWKIKMHPMFSCAHYPRCNHLAGIIAPWFSWHPVQKYLKILVKLGLFNLKMKGDLPR